jgi:hypothetical protein
MDINNENEVVVPSENVPPSLTKSTLSPESYDADTPSIVDAKGRKTPLRIAGVGGTEIGAGSDAEYFRNGLYGIFSGSDVEQTDLQGKGVFKREIGNLEVEGMDWRHLLYEVGVSDNWTNYGYDEMGSEQDERYKWYAGQSQSTNIEAYELLESGIKPNEIISDEDFDRIELLRKSLKTHMSDAQEGVLDKDQAKLVGKELMSNPELLTLAQKRRWYEKAQNSTTAKVMLANWNDPFTRSDIESQGRVTGMDVTPRVDTSYWAMTKNAINQWSDTTSQKTDIQHMVGWSEQDLHTYIVDNDVPPEVAAKMYTAYETDGGMAAVEIAEYAKIDAETIAIGQSLANQKGAASVAKEFYHAAAPYLTDPVTYVGGSMGAKVTVAGSKILFQKVASPLTKKLMTGFTVGAGTGLGESFVFTGHNYKDFTNDELLKTWALDAGFGGAFGAIFAGAAHGIDRYGASAKAKAAGEGLDDIEYRRSTDEIRDRMDDMQDEIATELQTGDTPTITQNIEVEARPTTPKPEPVHEPMVSTEHASAPAGKPKTDEPPVDTRTPEEIEAADASWQAAEVDLALQHQMDVVQPAMEAANKSHNWIAKVHRAIGKGVGLQEFASKMMFSKDSKMAYIGSHILETGAGFTGKFKRKASAAMTKDAIYTRNVANLNESYVRNIEGWVAEQGHGAYKQFKAAWEGGKVNDLAKSFHRTVFRYQEALQMNVPHIADNDLVSPFIRDYVTALNKVNDELFDGRIAANIKGFDAARRIKNYIPHVWKKVKVGEITKRHGEQAVLDLLTKSIESAKRAGKLADDASTSELAERQLNWINGLGDSMEHTDTIGAGVSGRGKSRIPLDFTTEHNGLSMVDLVDTDIPSIMDSYIQRAGADIGISDATGGLIRSEGDFNKFLMPDSESDKLLAQDAADMLYGRPTRQGMSPELRSIMDLVTVQQMGGIGVAQLAETGTMAQRLIVNYFSQPKIGKKIWAMAGESMDDKGVMGQVRSIAAVNDNMQYINRYSVNNIDQAQVDELSNLRAASIDAVDKATLGAFKAQFGRMLGSLSGVNAVQKAQSRLLQASFSVDIARGFKFGKGTSTPKRLADLGLTDDGMVATSMREFVEFDVDGFPTNFNFEQWSKPALDEFVHAMNREEAQLMPRVMAGELPVFMNRPIWQAIMQFRKTPLAFMSKGAQRNLQFADREAVLGTVLNAMTAGVTRYAKVAAGAGAYVALSDAEFHQPTADQMQTENYVSNLGILGDLYNLSKDGIKAYQEKDGIESLWEGAKSVPVLSSMDAAMNAVQGDPAAIKQITPLNTLPLMNEVTNAVIKSMEQN